MDELRVVQDLAPLEEEPAMTERHNSDEESGRRGFLGAAMAAAAGGSLAALSAAPDAACAEATAKAKRTALAPGGLPPADSGYSQGILCEAGRLVCVSGQIPDDLNAPVETQLRQILEKIGKVLGQAGASFENVVLVRGYFMHLLRDLPVYRKVRKDYLVQPYPASTCVGVTELAVPGLQIEIEAIAVV
jgi:enamine deaminase RidA (YjgF/YER057c/UK114 family)